MRLIDGEAEADTRAAGGAVFNVRLSYLTGPIVVTCR